MGIYVASAFSEHLFEEGFLAKKLDNLVESGVAVNGLAPLTNTTEKLQPYLMYLAYDIKGHPYVIYNSFYTKEVAYEFTKRLLRPIKSIFSDDIEVLIEDIDSGRLHKQFKKVAKKIIRSNYLKKHVNLFRN